MDRSGEGKSTYAVDDELPTANGNSTEEMPTVAVMLFDKSGLPPGAHTLSIKNVRVALTLWYFKVQEAGASPFTTPSIRANT